MIQRTHIALFVAFLLTTASLTAQTTCRLTLEVVGMKEKKGNLLISVYNSAEDYLK